MIQWHPLSFIHRLNFTAVIGCYMIENINNLEGVQRHSARFVCNKYSQRESVTTMLNKTRMAITAAEKG